MFKHILAALLALVAASTFAAVDINRANQAELEAVKGVGTSTAAKILDERKKGSFHDWNDVMQRVGGIKEAKAGKLSAAGLTVNGEAYHAPASLPGKSGKSGKGRKSKDPKSADGKTSASGMKN